MARILFITWGGGGNQTPALGAAQALRRAGHQVSFAGYASQTARFADAGFPLTALDQADAVWTQYRASAPLMEALIAGIFACPGHLDDIDRVLTGIGPDLCPKREGGAQLPTAGACVPVISQARLTRVRTGSAASTSACAARSTPGPLGLGNRNQDRAFPQAWGSGTATGPASRVGDRNALSYMMPLFVSRAALSESGARCGLRRLGRWKAVPGKPGSELVRGADTIIDHGGVDLQAADVIRVSRPAVPVVFDAQHRDALLGGDAVAQVLVPDCDIVVQVVQPQCQVDLPATVGVLHGDGHLIPLPQKRQAPAIWSRSWVLL